MRERKRAHQRTTPHILATRSRMIGSEFEKRSEHYRLLFTTPGLDFCNSLFYGSPKHCLLTLETMLTSTAKALRGEESAGREVIHRLHWLAVTYRIYFKLAASALKFCIVVPLNI